MRVVISRQSVLVSNDESRHPARPGFGLARTFDLPVRDCEKAVILKVDHEPDHPAEHPRNRCPWKESKRGGHRITNLRDDGVAVFAVVAEHRAHAERGLSLNAKSVLPAELSFPSAFACHTAVLKFVFVPISRWRKGFEVTPSMDMNGAL